MFAEFLTWFSGLEIGIQAALISASVAILVQFVGVWLNSWANRRNATKLEQQKLKVQVFKDAMELIGPAIRAQIDASGYLRNSLSQIQTFANITRDGLPVQPPRNRPAEFSRLHFEFTEEHHLVHAFVERWGIIHPDLEAFRLGFSVRHSRALTANRDVYERLLFALPMDHVRGGQLPYAPQTPEQIVALQAVADRYFDEVGMLSNYYVDLGTSFNFCYWETCFPGALIAANQRTPGNSPFAWISGESSKRTSWQRRRHSSMSASEENCANGTV